MMTALLIAAAFLEVNEAKVSVFDNPWQDAETCRYVLSGRIGFDELKIDTAKTDQSVLGFGCAVSELSWEALWLLPEADRAEIFDELCGDGGFTVMRTPIGSSDFGLDYYSLDDHDGDFAMEKFSIERDKGAIIPLLKEFTKRIDPSVLRVWASPWCPPKWMKVTGRYASRTPWDGGVANDCPDELRIYEGEDGFICDKPHFAAYALYFRKYVDAMREAGVPIAWVMPQNEPNSAQPYPSCTWKVASLADFTLNYLCPALEGSGTDVMYGTMERRSMEMPDSVLADPANRSRIKGIGFQWEGQAALEPTHRRYPDVMLLGTEQECGDGKNDAAHARHAWDLIRNYFSNGVSVYEYWNLALKTGSVSRWGWTQNSLVCTDPDTRTWKFNYEYYVLKHLSHFVKRGAKRIVTDGSYTDGLAFVNPDGSVIVALGNDGEHDRLVRVELNGDGDSAIAVTLPAKSLATVSIR